MKRIFIALVLMGGIFGNINAQDVITKKNGEDVKAKVLEVNQNEIKYKKFDNQNGPTFTISTSDILLVRYENGTNDVFNSTAKSNQNYDNITAEGIKPNMPYKYYKNKYDTNFYTAQYDDPYNPTVSGLCSFFIPGLGQMIDGEVGRGFKYLGGVIGCSIVSGIGSGLIASGDNDTVGAVLILAGAVGALTIDICSIVDAVHVAKVKNMYTRDVRKMSSTSIKMHPYIETVSIGGERVTPVGLSLQFSF